MIITSVPRSECWVFTEPLEHPENTPMSLNCSNLCIALRLNHYFKVQLNRILCVKTRYVSLETAKERRKVSKNVISTRVIVSYFDYKR